VLAHANRRLVASEVLAHALQLGLPRGDLHHSSDPMPDAPAAIQENGFRFVRFIVVGGTAYAVQWVTMKLFVGWFSTNAAFTLSFLCSSATHYSLNRFWALPSTRHDSWRQFAEYAATAALSWCINFALFRLCIDVLGLGKLWATAIAVPPSTVVVFLLLNFRVFRAKRLDPLR
jgi:putative flippase GtrA